MEKYIQTNPKKEGVDIWRSTDGQTPKSKELIFGEVQTGKSQKGKSWPLTKQQQAILVKRERTDAYKLSQKGKSGSSNTNDPQITIAGSSRD